MQCSCNAFNFECATCTHVTVGVDYVYTLTFIDEDGPIDLTGSTLSGEIKDQLGGTLLLNLPQVFNDSTTGFYIPDATTGEINFQITQADTITVGEGIFPYEIILTNSGGKDFVFMEGTIQFIDRGF